MTLLTAFSWFPETGGIVGSDGRIFVTTSNEANECGCAGASFLVRSTFKGFARLEKRRNSELSVFALTVDIYTMLFSYNLFFLYDTL